MTRPAINCIAPGFLVRNAVCRDGAMIFLKAGGVDRMPNRTRPPWAGWDADINVPDPDALPAEYASRDVSFYVPLKDTSGGLRGFELKDADGYFLFFGRPRGN
jgi:hypothetical protein